MRKVYLFIAVIMIAALLAACAPGAQQPGASGANASQPEVSVGGNTDNGAVSAAVIEPEQLISKDEAAQFAGAVNDGEKTEQPAVGQKIMFYETADGEGFLQISLTQQAFMKTEGNTPEAIYMGIKGAAASGNAESAEGVGDEYFFGTPGLYILYKGYYILIAAGNSEDPGVRSILKQAGALAVSNLDKILSK